MRPSKDQWGLELAKLTAQRATCLRRAVGCVLVNARGQVLSTGYNGVASGLPHCNEGKTLGTGSIYDMIRTDYPHACPNAQAPQGSQSDCCQAIHAEQNALLQCRDVYEIHTCYVTLSPCATCVKLLMNTSCQRIVFWENHYHQEAKDLWKTKWKSNSAWVHRNILYNEET